MMTYAAKYKAGSIAYVLDSEKDDETKKESSEEDVDIFIAHPLNNTASNFQFHSAEAKAFSDTYMSKLLTFPYIKGFHIPPEA